MNVIKHVVQLFVCARDRDCLAWTPFQKKHQCTAHPCTFNTFSCLSLFNSHYCSPFCSQQYVLILNWITINCSALSALLPWQYSHFFLFDSGFVILFAREILCLGMLFSTCYCICKESMGEKGMNGRTRNQSECHRKTKQMQYCWLILWLLKFSPCKLSVIRFVRLWFAMTFFHRIWDPVTEAARWHSALNTIYDDAMIWALQYYWISSHCILLIFTQFNTNWVFTKMPTNAFEWYTIRLWQLHCEVWN